MKKSIAIIGLLVLGITNLNGQSNLAERTFIRAQLENPTLSFKEICERAEVYFGSLNEETEADEVLEEDFEKWNEYWGTRCYYNGCRSGGDVAGAKLLMATAAFSHPRCQNSIAGASPWISEGPNTNTNGLCNIGFVSALATDPNNTSTRFAASNTGGLFRSFDAGLNWTNVTESFNFPDMGIRDIGINPNNSMIVTIAANNGIGIIQSSDGGTTWTPSNIFSSNPSTLLYTPRIKYTGGYYVYAAVDDKIWYRPAYLGLGNWSSISAPVGANFNQLNACSSSTVPLTTRFTDIETVTINSSARTFASTSNVGGAGIPYLMEIQGTSMVQIPLPPGINPVGSIVIDATPADPGFLYAHFLENPGCNPANEIYTLAKYNGSQWTIIAQTPIAVVPSAFGASAYFNDVFEMSDIVQNVCYVGSTQVIKGHFIGGSTFTYNIVSDYAPTLTVNTHADIRCIEVRSNGTNEVVQFGCDGGIIETTDQTATWSCVNNTGLNLSQFYSIASFNRSNNLIVAPQDNWVKLKTANTWQVANNPIIANINGTVTTYVPGWGAESCWTEVNYMDDNVVYYSNWNEISKSSDGGLNSYTTENPMPAAELGKRFFLDPTNPNVVWSGQSGGSELHKYTSTGAGPASGAWQLINAPGGGTCITEVVAVAVAPTNSQVIIKAHSGPTYDFCGSNVYQQSGKIFKSMDGGVSWTDITNNLGGICHGFGASHVLFDPLNEKRIFISFGGYGIAYQSSPPVAANRILKSEDGGATWTDISNGLTPYSVNHFVYQNGTNDVMYAATDFGVWRYNKTLVTGGITGTWECFNQGLPPVVVRKVDLNYCRKKLFVATYGRGAYSCDLPQVPVFQISTALVNAINGTSVTSPTLTLPTYYYSVYANDVIVDANVYLKQQGTLSFNPNHAFTVAKKAHMVLTGTMTTYCPQLWKGIQVSGDINGNQSYSQGFAVHQGILEVLNGGTVKNAVVGITTGTYNTNGQVEVNSKGAVISCANAHFINNKKDVDFLTYTKINKSQFNNCNFETNALLLGGVVPVGHVSMYYVNNIIFRGCNFNYTAGNAYPVGSRGYGIYSTDARYTVDLFCSTSTCPAPVRTKFQNLNVGIKSTASNPLQSATVKNSDFLNNTSDGAFFQTINYLTFVNNNITVGTPSINATSGLYLNVCKFYSVQNNTIVGVGYYTTPNNFGYATNGIIAQNSDLYSQTPGGNHLINRNTVNNCYISIAAQNKNAINAVGLKMRCNDMGLNTNNYYDIAMTGNNPAVDYTQGSPASNINFISRLVGNRYSANCQGYLYGAKWHVDPSGTNPLSHANNPDAVCTLTPQPSCSNYQVLPSNSQFNYQSSQCPNNYQSPKSSVSLNTDISNGKAAVLAALNSQISQIDAGNTSALLALINGNTANSELLSTLQNASPYLSDVVLSAYFSKTSIPTANITDIHNRNKPVTAPVWQLLLNRGFSSTVMTTLGDQQNSAQVSARRVLETDLDEATYNLNMAYREKVSYFLNDSIDASIDTAMATVALAEFSDTKCQLIAAQITLPNNTITASVIDELHGGASHVDAFCQFQKLAITANQASEKWDVLISNNDLKTSLMSIASNDNNLAQQLAQGPLAYVIGNEYSHPYLLPQENSGSRTVVPGKDETNAETGTIAISEGLSLMVYPNPTNGNVTILIKQDSGMENTSFQLDVKNNVGQQIFSKFIDGNKVQQLNTLDLPNGIYMLRLSQNNKFLKETKLVIMK